MTLTAAEILIDQEPVSGLTVKVSIPNDKTIEYVNIEFNDMKTGNSVSTLDAHFVGATGWSSDGSNNFRSFTMESTNYLEAIQFGELATGALIQVLVWVKVVDDLLISKNQPDLPYYQPLTFAIDSVPTSFNSLIVNLSNINDLVYAQNNDVEAFDAAVTLYRSSGHHAMSKQYIITKTATDVGTATIVMDDLSGSGLEPVHGAYEIKVQVKNSMIPAGFSVRKDITITNEPGTVKSNNFKTFDPSGSKFTLEYDASKNYVGYENVNVYASFKKNDTTDGTPVGDARYLVGGDISGTVFENSKPTTYFLPPAVKSLLPQYDESKGSDSTKFTATFWIEAQEVDETVTLAGNKSASDYWLDTELALPTVTLQSVDFGSGDQTIYVVADGSFNTALKPKVVYDLSGVATDPSTFYMTISGEVLAYNTKTYTYAQLENADGYLKVSASRREVNNQGGDYTNTAPVQTLAHLLSPIQSANAPTANFTITAGPDSTNGTVEVVFTDSIDLCGNTTDLLATLNLDGVEINDVSGAIATDASDTQFDFGNIVSGKTYTAKAYSRFNMSGLDPRYTEINGSDPLLRSAVKQDATLFTTSPPTMTMYVLPTGDTNDLKTVRMDGEANANQIVKLQVYALQDGGKVATQQLDIDGSAGTVTTGGEELRSDYDADDLSYNAAFRQDFSFNEVIDVAADGKMFVLGIIDTPNQVDAIQTDISATNELLALRNAINTYNADIIVYEAAYDLSANPNGDAQYSDASAAYIAWGASMETLSNELVDVTDLLNGSDASMGSLAHLDTAITDNSGALLLQTAAAATRKAAGLAFTAWTNQYTIASVNTHPTKVEMEQGNFTYDNTTVSGEELVTSDFDASAVNQSHVGTLLTTTIDDLNTASTGLETAADDLLTSETAYTEKAARKVLLADVKTVPGSVAYAFAQRGAKALDMGNRYAALLHNIITKRVALVGKDGNDVEGDAQAPLGTGSILVMNDARTALGAIVKGVIAAFAVPALKGTLVPPV